MVDAQNRALHPRSPERVNDRSRRQPRELAFLDPLEDGWEVLPTRFRHLEVVDHTSVRLVDLVQDEAGVAGWGRVEISRIGSSGALDTL